MSHPTTDSSPRIVSAWLPDVSLLGVAVIWGTNIPFMKMGLGLLDNVYVFNALRLAISVTVLVVLAWRERSLGIRPEPGIRLRHIAVYSMVVSVLYHLTFLIGMTYTTPGNAALILATVPMWTAVLAWLFLRERLRMIAWLGLGVALAGTVVVAVQKGGVSSESNHLFGNLVMLSAALFWSSGTVYSRPLLERTSPLQLAAAASLMGLPFHILFAVLATKSDGVLTLAEFGSRELWLIILFSGIFSSGLALPMWHFGVRHAGAAHAAIVQNLVPLVAVFATWVVFETNPTLPQILGGMLILGGLFLMRMGRNPSLRQR